MRGVLEYAASMVGVSAAEKLDRLRRQECFHGSYLEQKSVGELFSDKRLHYFIQSMCQRLSLETPTGIQLVTFKADLDVQLKFYFNGEVRDEDFVPIFRAMVHGDGILQDQALRHIQSKCGSLAKYLGGRCRGAIPEGPEEKGPEIPCCRDPFYQPLHAIAARCGATVVVDENHVSKLRTDLRASHFLAMEAHSSPIWSGKKPEVDLVVIRCQTRIFALAPQLYPEVVASVGKLLRDYAASKWIFVWKGDVLFWFCQQQLRWTPENFVDIADVCKKT
jgi:hypothetical protein